MLESTGVHVVAVEPAAFDDRREYFRVDPTEAKRAPLQRGTIAHFAESLVAAVVTREADLCECVGDFVNAATTSRGLAHADELRLPQAASDSISHRVERWVFKDDATHPLRQFRSDSGGNHRAE